VHSGQAVDTESRLSNIQNIIELCRSTTMRGAVSGPSRAAQHFLLSTFLVCASKCFTDGPLRLWLSAQGRKGPSVKPENVHVYVPPTASGPRGSSRCHCLSRKRKFEKDGTSLVRTGSPTPLAAACVYTVLAAARRNARNGYSE
jgi:hypothetical protein